MRDADLGARAGVSRTTVREALSLLAREGLLTHSLHRGMEVARIAPGDVRDIYAMRRLLERAGAETLIASAPASVEPLQQAVSAMTAAAARRDRRRVVEADEAFHTALVAALGNTRLQAAMQGAMQELRLVLSVTDRAYDDLDEEVRQHMILLDDFRERSPDALPALEIHLLRSEAMVCAAIEEAVAPGPPSPHSHRA